MGSIPGKVIPRAPSAACCILAKGNHGRGGAGEWCEVQRTVRCEQSSVDSMVASCVLVMVEDKRLEVHGCRRPRNSSKGQFSRGLPFSKSRYPSTGSQSTKIKASSDDSRKIRDREGDTRHHEGRSSF